MKDSGEQPGILIITPYFAPQSHAAVFRAYKLAKYLPRYGFRVHVLTVDKNYLYNEDPTLLSELPSFITVHKSKYVEPTIRGVRMALGGKDRTFRAVKDSAVKTSNINLKRKSLWGRTYGFVLEGVINIPDPYWTWKKSAVKKARRIIKDNNIKVVFTSANPYTSHNIGYELKKKAGVKWVADLRDPHTYCSYMHSKYWWVYAQQVKAEKRAVFGADAITVASSAIEKILADQYGLDESHPIYFIPTGVDDTVAGKDCDDVTAKDSENRLVFTGEYHREYGNEFFKIFQYAISNYGEQFEIPRIVFVGRRENNEPIISAYARECGVEQHVEYIDNVSQKKLYGILKRSKAGLLLTSRRFCWWCLFAKLVDYIGLCIPVVAVLPDPSEARTRLNESGLGLFLDEDIAKAAKKLASFLGGTIKIRYDKDVVARYHVLSQVEAFIKVIKNI